jgi:hypothetical protein
MTLTLAHRSGSWPAFSFRATALRCSKKYDRVFLEAATLF